jgi:hypothetical protein
MWLMLSMPVKYRRCLDRGGLIPMPWQMFTQGEINACLVSQQSISVSVWQKNLHLLPTLDTLLQSILL